MPPEKADMNRDFEHVVKAVAEAMDLSPCQILCKRRFQETIDARWIAVCLLSEKGFYSSRIAAYMGMTTRNVNLILSSMHLRLATEKQLRSNLEAARKYLNSMDM
jgi:hypothetical protein